jgi:subtilisin family serine protease
VSAVDGKVPPALADAVTKITDRYPKVLIVASAGNSGTTEKMYPAAFEPVVAVGALTSDKKPAEFTNRGDWVDCSAVGVGIISTFVIGTEPPEKRADATDVCFKPDSWGLWSGTSFSAPQIAGAVARLCEINPDATPREVFDAWKDTMEQDEEKLYGGMIRILWGTPIS